MKRKGLSLPSGTIMVNMFPHHQGNLLSLSNLHSLQLLSKLVLTKDVGHSDPQLLVTMQYFFSLFCQLYSNIILNIIYAIGMFTVTAAVYRRFSQQQLYPGASDWMRGKSRLHTCAVCGDDIQSELVVPTFRKKVITSSSLLCCWLVNAG